VAFFVARWVPGAGEVGENEENAWNWGIVKTASEIERSPSDLDEITVFYVPLPQAPTFDYPEFETSESASEGDRPQGSKKLSHSPNPLDSVK
jgi:hypothetical protein